MRTDFAQWLDGMQHEADADGVTVAARHIDVLGYYFILKLTPQEAFLKYKNEFLPRWNAITENGKNTETA
jgi:hypothetical protein